MLLRQLIWLLFGVISLSSSLHTIKLTRLMIDSVLFDYSFVRFSLACVSFWSDQKDLQSKLYYLVRILFLVLSSFKTLWILFLEREFCRHRLCHAEEVCAFEVNCLEWSPHNESRRFASSETTHPYSTAQKLRESVKNRISDAKSAKR